MLFIKRFRTLPGKTKKTGKLPRGLFVIVRFIWLRGLPADRREQPRIRVEVKHRRNKMGSEEIRSFTGGLRTNDRGLYVSTEGFSKEAHYEAERSPIPLTLLDLDDLVSLLLQHYESIDIETRALIPLVRVYWPTP